MRPVIIVRPEPGAAQTVTRARALGLNPLIQPLFSLSSVDWSAPDIGAFDGLMLTSANAIVHGGEGLRALTPLPVLAVGQTTAQAARDAGFTIALTGEGSAQDLVDHAHIAGYRRLLRLVGTSPAPAQFQDGSITACQVYSATALSPRIAPNGPAIALLHSTKAAQRFSTLFLGERVLTDVIAISAKVASAAGSGWRSISIAQRPDDAALLALARNLCEQDVS